MKTAYEVARELIIKLDSSFYSFDVTQRLEAIAQALTAYAEELVKEDQQKALDVSRFVEKARVETLEEAANSLNKLYVMKGSENDGMIFIGHAQEYIRALKDKP